MSLIKCYSYNVKPFDINTVRVLSVTKNSMVRLLLFSIISTLLLTSCEAFEETPFSMGSRHLYLNNKNYQELLNSVPNDSIVRFAFIGDTQRFYDDTEEAVEKINSIPDIDFTIISGDLTDFGLLYEFDQMDRILNKLYKPYFSVIGNHDIVANGVEIFKDYYGDLNTSIEYLNVKFLLFNTNGVSTGFDGTAPNMNWLKTQLDISTDNKWVIGVSHIPPNNVDFDPALKSQYEETLSEYPNFLVSLHGHNHNMADWQTNGVDYINSSSTSKKELIVITLSDTGYTKEVFEF